MSFLLILAEGSSLSGLIHFIELLMSATALPALAGFVVLCWGRFRPREAGAALFLGLMTVLLAGGLCGWVWWESAARVWYEVLGPCLAVGLLVCALALISRQRRPSGQSDGA